MHLKVKYIVWLMLQLDLDLSAFVLFTTVSIRSWDA